MNVRDLLPKENSKNLIELDDGSFCDEDGVIEEEVTQKKKFVLRRPEPSKHKLEGAINTFKKIIEVILLVDKAIYNYAELLNRAQPLNSGRVAIIFKASDNVMYSGKIYKDVEPVVVRMVLFTSGKWGVAKAPPYKKLEELRVGRNLYSDRLVVRLLKVLDELFARRKKLCSYLTDFRRPSLNDLTSTGRFASSNAFALPDLEARLKLDWAADAKGCRESIRADNKRRAEAKREKSAAIALAKSTSH